MNSFDDVDKIFYKKKDGKIFECFKNKPMEEIQKDLVKNIVEFNRQKGISYILINERQVKSFKEFIDFINNPLIILEDYYSYNIISKEEYNNLKELIK